MQLTDQELRTKKYWLYYTLAVLGFSLICAGMGIIGKEYYPKKELLYAFSGIALKILLFFLTYLLCYKKNRTFLLTLSLISSFFYLFVMSLALVYLAYAFSRSVMEGLLNFCFGALLLMGIPFWGLSLTLRLRSINKMLRCYQKFPTESEELIQVIRSSPDLSSLTTLFQNQKQEKPFLKPLLRREWKLKKKEFDQAAAPSNFSSASL